MYLQVPIIYTFRKNNIEYEHGVPKNALNIHW